MFSSVFARAEQRGNEASRSEELDSTICQFLKEQRVPGATLAVAKHGRIVYQQGYGVAGAGRQTRAGTKLRVASISKPLTAIAVLRLCQEGRLSLDTPVFGAEGILKRLKVRGDKRLRRITVRHLLQHSAGWDRDLVGDAVFWKIPPPPHVKVTSAEYNAYLLQYVLNRKLQFTPGTRHAYSNIGYLALGEVIEEVTGQKYDQYMKSLLAKVGVTGMYIGSEERADWQSDEAEYFNIRDPPTAPSIMPGQEGSHVLPQYGSFLMRNTGAFGGWVGTAQDVLKVFLTLRLSCERRDYLENKEDLPSCCEHSGQPQNCACSRENQLLNNESIKKILEKPPYESGRDWYGLGFDVQDWGKTWGHTGAMEGTCGTVQCHRSGISWAFLLNAWATDSDLDGVVKMALSSVPELTPFPGDLTLNSAEGMQIQTQDGVQRTLLWVPFEAVSQTVEMQKTQGYNLVWMGTNPISPTAPTSHLSGGHSGAKCINNGDRSSKPVSFNIIFSKHCEQDRKLLLGIDVENLQEVLRKCAKDGFQPEHLTTFVHKDKLQALVVLVHTEHQPELEIDMTVPATIYVKLLAKRRKCGSQVVSQCVTQWKGELLVTAIMKKQTENSSGQECGESVVETASEEKGLYLDGKSHLISPVDCDSSTVSSFDEMKHSELNSLSDLEIPPTSPEAPQYHLQESQVSHYCAQQSSSTGCTSQLEKTVSEGNTAWSGLKSSSVCESSDTSDQETRQSDPQQPTGPSNNMSSFHMSTRKLGKSSYALPRPTKVPTSPAVSCSPSKSPSPRKTRSSPLKTLSWVQMAPDSFLTELGRQAKRHCTLRDLHYYMADGEPFVSGVWLPRSSILTCPLSGNSQNDCYHRVHVSDVSTHPCVSETRTSAHPPVGMPHTSTQPSSGNSHADCYHRVGVSRYGLLPALAEAAASNIKVRFICQYVEEGAVCHALIWDAVHD